MAAPTRPVTELGDRRLVPLEPAHLPTLALLLGAPGNALLVDAPDDPDQLLELVGGLVTQPFALAMLSVRAGIPDGALATALPNVRNLSVYLLAVFQDPAEADSALALYLHNLFWTYPVQRVYVHVPDLPATAAYRALLERSGFVHEGTLAGHAVNDGRRVDVSAYGLLRADFDRLAAPAS